MAIRHGAQATLALQPRAEAIAQELRDLVPARTDADEPAIRVLSLVLARIEAANASIAKNGLLDARGRPRSILKLVSSWENSASRLLGQLGLTPTSRAALGLDLVTAKSRSSALKAHLVEHYGNGRAES